MSGRMINVDHLKRKKDRITAGRTKKPRWVSEISQGTRSSERVNGLSTSLIEGPILRPCTLSLPLLPGGASARKKDLDALGG